MRRLWTEATGHGQNDAMHKGLFFDTLGEIGNMQPEERDDGPGSDIYYVMCGLVAGYVEERGIKEAVVSALQAVNSHVLVVISSDVDTEEQQVLVLHGTQRAALGSPRENASKRYPVDEAGEMSFVQVAQISTGDGY